MSLAKAFEDDTLLAYAMNGEPVPADHGVSGAGHRARLGRHQQHQVGGAHRGAEQRDRRAHHDQDLRPGRPRLPEQGGAAPADDQERGGAAVGLRRLPAGRQRVRGFAWSPVGRISRVEYSLDRGATWQAAALREPNIARAWARWDFEWDARPGDHVILDAGHRRPGQRAAGQHALERPGLRLQRAGAHPVQGGLTDLAGVSARPGLPRRWRARQAPPAWGRAC